MRVVSGLVLALVFWLALGLAQGRVVAACDPVANIKFICGLINVQTPRELSTETSNVVQLDPKTLTFKRLFFHPYIKGFGGPTTAIKIGNEMWLGTYRGEIIPYFPFPNPE